MNDIDKLLKQLSEEKTAKYKGGIYYYTQTELAYNSNRIEGSRLSRGHTKSLFETKTFIAEKDELIRSDDVIETTNHFRAFDYILDHSKELLSESMIKDLHRILKCNTSDADLDWFNVGEYKAIENEIGENKATTLPKNVSRDIKILLATYQEIENKKVEDIIDFHVAFESIHPFQDGNGRVGRLIMFKECLINGVVPFIIDVDHKEFYYRGLRNYSKEKGWLVDTCLSAQDKYEAYCKKFVLNFGQNNEKSDPKSKSQVKTRQSKNTHDLGR